MSDSFRFRLSTLDNENISRTSEKLINISYELKEMGTSLSLLKTQNNTFELKYSNINKKINSELIFMTEFFCDFLILNCNKTDSKLVDPFIFVCDSVKHSQESINCEYIVAGDRNLKKANNLSIVKNDDDSEIIY